MTRAALLLLLLPAACGGGPSGGPGRDALPFGLSGGQQVQPPASEARVPAAQQARDRRQEEMSAADCRTEADRVVLFRDRGQLMREDELDARVGSITNIPTVRAETDRLGRQFERDRLAAQCVRGNERELDRSGTPGGNNAAPAVPPPGGGRGRS